MSRDLADVAAGRTFAPPGKGPWELETTHFARPCTRVAQQCFREGFVRGFSEGTAKYGLLLSHLEPAVSADFIYMQPVAVGAPKGAMGPPPKPVMMLLSRVHPALRQRINTAVTAFAEKRWRSDLVHWDEVDKPAIVVQHRTIQAVDVTTLSDAALADHVDTCLAHLTESNYLHHKYTMAACLPVGDFLAGAQAWTGRPIGELMALVRGASEISRGFAAEELDHAAKVIAVSDDAYHQLGATGPSEEVLAVLAGHPDVGTAVTAYLEAVRWRCVGYDVGDFAAGELPDVLLETLRTAVRSPGHGAHVHAVLAEIRDQVPTEHLTDFDDRLDEMRRTYRLRDERAVFCDGWATGLARRALLEVGRRLASTGALHDARHGVDLEPSEVSAALREASRPDAAAVAERYRWRTTVTVADAPPYLTALPAPPPPVQWLPAKARRSAAAIDVFMASLFGVAETPNTETVLTGLAVNHGIYEGTARLVDDSSDFDRIQEGDVLVTRMTSPYFNVVLPLLGAIVTDRGGQLCHAAIVAREYGIPGIVGTRDATRVIPDGARVRVDGSTGEVRLLE